MTDLNYQLEKTKSDLSDSNYEKQRAETELAEYKQKAQ